MLSSVEGKFKQPLSNFEAETRKKLSNLSLAEKTVACKIESSVLDHVSTKLLTVLSIHFMRVLLL